MFSRANLAKVRTVGAFFQAIQTTRRYDIAAMVFCLLMLIVALIIGHFHQVGAYGVETDFYGNHARGAEELLAGRLMSSQYNYDFPGYTLLLAGISWFAGDPFVAGKIISAFATALLGWIT